jgi:hypothetical protein
MFNHMQPASKITRDKRHQGVYSRESSVKRHLGKPDRCYDISCRDERGKLIWEKIGWASQGYTAKDALHIRSERLCSIRHGEELPSHKKREVTLAEVWVEYNKHIATEKIRPSDERSYYKNHLQSRFADKSLSKITPFDLEKLKSDLIKKGKSPATVKHMLGLMRQIYNKAVAWGLWSGENPVHNFY